MPIGSRAIRKLSQRSVDYKICFLSRADKPLQPYCGNGSCMENTSHGRNAGSFTDTGGRGRFRPSRRLRETWIAHHSVKAVRWTLQEDRFRPFDFPHDFTPVRLTVFPEETLKRANYPALRQFLPGDAVWVVFVPDTAPAFRRTAFCFARRLQQDALVPAGLGLGFTVPFGGNKSPRERQHSPHPQALLL